MRPVYKRKSEEDGEIRPIKDALFYSSSCRHCRIGDMGKRSEDVSRDG